MLDLARQRSTLIALLLAPVVMTLFFTLARDRFTAEISGGASAVHYRVAVQGAGSAPDLVAAFREAKLVVVPVDDASRVVSSKRAPVGALVPPGFATAVAAGRPVVVTLVIADHSLRNQIALARLQAAVATYGRTVALARLRSAHVPGEILDPVATRLNELSSSRQRSGGLLGDLLAVFVLFQVIVFVGGMAMEATTGEKVGRTMEALLAAPVERRELATATVALSAALGFIVGAATLGVGIMMFRFSTAPLLEVTPALPRSAVPFGMAAVAAASLIVAALGVLIGLWAKSQQQASAFMMPLYSVVLVGFLGMQTLGGSSVGAPLYAIPLMGPALLMRFGFGGTTVAGALAVVLVSTVVYTAILIACADRVVKSERVLMRAS